MKMESRFGGRRLIDCVSILLLGSIVLYWLKYIEKIGLHGDEAWAGLDGMRIMQHGISRPYGIVPYTGLLQSLANAGMFTYFDVGVIQLRITGIVCNILAVGALVYFLRSRFTPLAALFFLLFFGQSAFYLLYAKIGWEVCSFNILFMALLVISANYVYVCHGRHRVGWSFVFLFVAFLAGYNHIIFSSLPMAGLVGVIVWTLFGKEIPSEGTVAVTVICFWAVLNSAVLYLGLRYYVFYNVAWLRTMPLLLPFVMMLVEYFLMNVIVKLFDNFVRRMASVSVHQALKILFLIVCFLSFSWFHGSLLIKVYSQKIIFIHILSYQLSLGADLYLLIAGSLLLSLLYYLFVKDILFKNSIMAYVLMSYLAILNIYTTIPSMRYLMIAGVLIFLYLSIEIVSERPVMRYVTAVLLIVNVITIQSTLWSVNLTSDRKVKPSYFTLNSNYMDNSAHFLNFSPVLKFIHQQKVGAIRTRDDFFIGNVFEFYRQTYPIIKGYQNTMEINYDYAEEGTGFEVSVEQAGLGIR